jgi:hypothetical protein
VSPRRDLDPGMILSIVQNAGSAEQVRMWSAMLHGWLAAGGAFPRWADHPMGTARFLGMYPTWHEDTSHGTTRGGS